MASHSVSSTVLLASGFLLGSAFAAELRKAGGSAEVHVYDTGGHGYGLRPVADQPVTTWPLRAADWMARRALLQRPAPAAQRP